MILVGLLVVLTAVAKEAPIMVAVVLLISVSAKTHYMHVLSLLAVVVLMAQKIKKACMVVALLAAQHLKAMELAVMEEHKRAYLHLLGKPQHNLQAQLRNLEHMLDLALVEMVFIALTVTEELEAVAGMVVVVHIQIVLVTMTVVVAVVRASSGPARMPTAAIYWGRNTT